MKPNFFIVGAPKCGTTALHTYLSEHPQVFMPSRKEPHFFMNTGRDRDVQTLEEYLSLFAEAPDTALAIGEASPNYLYSNEALQAIHEFNPQAKIILMVRQPIDYLLSMHAYRVFRLSEDQEDFESAWRLIDARKEGKSLPRRTARADYDYATMGKLGLALQNIQSVFGADQVHVAFFDDLKNNPKALYESTLAFLGVPSDGRTEFPPVNEGRSHGKHKWLTKMFVSPPPVVKKLAGALGLKHTGLSTKVTSKLGGSKKKAQLRPEFRQELKDYFAEDIQLLSELTGRDLSAWQEA